MALLHDAEAARAVAAPGPSKRSFARILLVGSGVAAAAVCGLKVALFPGHAAAADLAELLVTPPVTLDPGMQPTTLHVQVHVKRPAADAQYAYLEGFFACNADFQRQYPCSQTEVYNQAPVWAGRTAMTGEVMKIFRLESGGWTITTEQQFRKEGKGAVCTRTDVASKVPQNYGDYPMHVWDWYPCMTHMIPDGPNLKKVSGPDLSKPPVQISVHDQTCEKGTAHTGRWPTQCQGDDV